MEIVVHSDFCSFGKTEDWEDFVGEVYSIIAQSPSGERWRYEHTFPGVKVEYVDHDDIGETAKYFLDVREQAQGGVERTLEALHEKLSMEGELDLNEWIAIAPAYGSEAHAEKGDLLAFGSDAERDLGM
jgi:hypothetical protein